MSRSKARPKRPAVPPLPSFESLDHTHCQVQATGIDDNARMLATEIRRFFDETARAHHAAEEQLVFPSLLASGDAELVQRVQRLQQDHGWLEEDWLELGPHLQAVSEGQGRFDLDTLRAAVPVFSELYRDRIALEESVVYPASWRLQG